MTPINNGVIQMKNLFLKSLFSVSVGIVAIALLANAIELTLISIIVACICGLIWTMFN